METRTLHGTGKSLGKTVQTDLTDAEALTILQRQLPNNSFACDLVMKSKGKYPLSEGQLFWVHTLALEATGVIQRPQDSNTIDLGTGVKGVFDLFSLAAVRGLKSASILIRLPNGDPLRIKPASDRSNYKGQLILTDGVYPNGNYYGRIDANGKLYKAQSCTPTIELELVKFGTDPAGYAAQQGQMWGRCMFCGKELNDPRSAAAGYGEVCAGYYNLPWGQQRYFIGAGIIGQPSIEEVAA